MNLYQTAGPVSIYRDGAWFRAECPCGWKLEGGDSVRGEALVHGYNCRGMTMAGMARE